MNILVWSLAGVVAAYLAVLARMILGQRSYIYFPPRRYPSGLPDLGFKIEEITFPAADGLPLNAWWVKPAKKGAPVFLYCHGNASTIHDLADIVPEFQKPGFGMLIFDYRGFGKSPGSPTERGLYQDVSGAYQWLRRRGIKPGQIFLWGKSLGGAVAAWLACHEPVAGLALESPFTSIHDMARLNYPWLLVPRALVWDRFPTEEYVSRCTCPVLVVHGVDDRDTPLAMGRRVYDAAQGPKVFIPVAGMGHGENIVDKAAKKKVMAFVAMAVKRAKRR